MSVLDQNIAIFKYFEEISKIPHGSFHEEKIADYVENFAKEHNFKYVRDDMNNVIIYKMLHQAMKITILSCCRRIWIWYVKKTRMLILTLKPML